MLNAEILTRTPLRMRSSSSSDEADSEAMFPAELDPPGSASQPHQDPLNSQPSGFTPPQSQDLSEAMDTGVNQEPVPLGQDLGRSGIQVAGNSGWVPQSDFAKSAVEPVREAGASWNNKKARDEYQRAQIQIEDKNFSLSE